MIPTLAAYLAGIIIGAAIGYIVGISNGPRFRL